jgi:MOSC domain-containing protein YiiM
MRVASVNIGRPARTAHSDVGVTGIDKRSVHGTVDIADPGPAGGGGGGLRGDAVCDTRHHGGRDQAVYAYAREDLDAWERDMGRELACGVFGENLTTVGLDITSARIGERWLVGASCVLQVTRPRLPCRTFAGWLADQGWVRRFTARGAPGAYLRVVTPGAVSADDLITVVHRPDHHITVGVMFRALTTEKRLLPALLQAGDALPDETRERALRAIAAGAGPAAS